jgi:hypothetical protein
MSLLSENFFSFSRFFGRLLFFGHPPSFSVDDSIYRIPSVMGQEFRCLLKIVQTVGKFYILRLQFSTTTASQREFVCL